MMFENSRYTKELKAPQNPTLGSVFDDSARGPKFRRTHLTCKQFLRPGPTLNMEDL